MTSQMRGEGLKVRALWYDAPGSAIVRDEILDASCPPGMALVATKWSAISRGTERLVMSGKVPAAEYGR
ncbi:MAG: dehydrogenase, partial [Beijerinckiaceae bacterium]|nr:dehydrogenase [Beijerinckiaceae bacterium]